MTSRGFCLQPAARNSLVGTAGHVFEDLPAPDEPSSALFGNSKNLASSSCRLKPFDTGKIAEQERYLVWPGSLRPGILNIMQEELILNIVSWSCRGIKSRNCIPIKSLTHRASSVARRIFKTEVCSCSGCPTVAMLWIKEVEVAKSVDKLMTSQSTEGYVVPKIEMLGAKIASALERVISIQMGPCSTVFM